MFEASGAQGFSMEEFVSSRLREEEGWSSSSSSSSKDNCSSHGKSSNRSKSSNESSSSFCSGAEVRGSSGTNRSRRFC